MSTGADEPTPSSALAVYGTLRPGEVNAFVLNEMPGQWIEAYVLGYEYEISWGPAEGYPGLTLSNQGNRVAVAVLVSDRWPDDFWKVDRFEGPGYERRVANLYDNSGECIGAASVYEALTDVD